MSTENDAPNNKDDDGYSIRPNKTVLKQENLALQTFILELSALSNEKLSALPIDDDCRHILGKINKLGPSNARKRELRYATKFFADWTPERIDEYKTEQLLATKRQIGQEKVIEQWLVKLQQDNAALTEFVADNANVNVQKLRQLIRKAKKEAAAGKSAAASESLAKFIRETL